MAIEDVLLGVSRGLIGMRQRREREEELARQRQQQDDDRRRALAVQDLSFAQQEGQQAYATGNYSLAALAAQKMNEAKNQFDGGERVGMKFIGTYGKEGTGQEQARPSATMQGPMPEAQRTTYDASKPDWKNPANIKGLAGLLAIQPQSFELSPGQSRYSVGPDGKPILQVTAPIPDNPYKMRADVQEELRRLGYSEAAARQQASIQAANDRQQTGIAAADRRQQVGISATNARQQTALGAADAKTFTASVNALAAQFPGIQVTSGQRSNAEQQALWEKDLASNGGKPTGRVARPGHSAHETGLARDVYVPKAQRAAFVAAARAQGFYVKDDYPDGHVHIAVPQGVRPAAPPAAAKPKAPTPPKPFDEKEAWAIAEKRFPHSGMGKVPPKVQADREAYVEKARREHAAAQRRAAGEKSAADLFFESLK